MGNHVPGPGGHTSLRGRSSECAQLEALVSAIRRGESRSLVLMGEAGIGKTALLEYLIESASDLTVLRAVGVESEMELAYASVHQLCVPLLEGLERLPAPQRDALRVVFGLSAAPAPDRFLVGLAVLSLLSEVAEKRPLLCVVDDAQWLDQASARTLTFVARRLLAERVGMVFAAREPGQELQHLPELEVHGLRNGDARALLASLAQFMLDERVRDRIIAETRGNPLALLELPRGLTPTQLAGGFGLLEAQTLVGRIEESFVRRLDSLPEDTRLLLLVAAAEPVGDPLLLWHAADRLGISPKAATAAEAEGLLAIGEQVAFRHPLVRSAMYQSAAVERRRAVHLALAGATDREADPDRRAWHLAAAAAGPDEDVALELERSADRAHMRGGVAAAAAFLERAAALSSDQSRRAARLLGAASAKREAGALDVALRLLSAVQAEALDEIGLARAQILAGEIAVDQLHAPEAARLLADAAKRLEPVAISLARETHLEALSAARWAGDRDGPAGMRRLARAALRAPHPPGSPTASDVLLDAFALLLCEGYEAAAPALHQALELVLAPETDDHWHRLWFALAGNAMTVAQELWDADSWHALAARNEQLARDAGALVHLQFGLNMLAWVYVLRGELIHSEALLEEGRRIALATGNPPIAHTELLIAAWRGQDKRATELIEAMTQQATAFGLRRFGDFAAYGGAVLYNGLRRHAEARDALRPAFAGDHAGLGPFVVPELVEAAARTGDTALLSSILDWLTERTRVTPSDWSLGIEARTRGFMSEGAAADGFYRESIERLRRTPVRVEFARAHLLHGEWLRRQGRRVEAREQLRTAHEMLTIMGLDAFAERARRELLATGERVRKQTVETRDDLTAQERQIAQLACNGLSNPEIGARLFLSPRTVEWHLHKVFGKLGIRSRHELANALARPRAEPVPARA